MVKLYVISLIVVVSFGQVHSQILKESKQILGKWTFTLTDTDDKGVGDRKTIKGLFRLEGDSIAFCIQDEYGNYEPLVVFHHKPKKSGPDGIYYEWIRNEVDIDGDSVETTHWLKFTDVRKRRVQISLGSLQQLKTESKGEYSTWSQSFKEKYRNWKYGQSSTLIGQRVK